MCALLSRTILLHLSLLVLAPCKSGDAANILAITPFPALSHTIPFVPLFQSLATQHNVTVITSNPNSLHPNSNIRTIDVTEVHDLDLPTELIEMITGYNIGKHHEIFRVVVQNPEVRALILGTGDEFDLVLTDITSSIWTVFGKRFSCPVVGLLPYDVFVVHRKMGTPSDPAVHSDSSVGLNYDMNAFEKIYNIFMGVLLMFNDFFYTQQKIDYYLEEYFPKADHFELAHERRDIAILFVNQLPGFHKLRATTESTRYIGSGVKYPQFEHNNTKNNQSAKESQKMMRSDMIVVYMELDNDESHVKLMDALQYVEADISWVKHPKWSPQQSRNSIEVIEPYEFQDLVRQRSVQLLIANADNHLIEISIQYRIPMLIVARPSSGQDMQNAQKLLLEKIATVIEQSDIGNIQRYIEDMLPHIDDYRKLLADYALRLRTPLSGLRSATIWLEWLLENGEQSRFDAVRAPTVYLHYIEAWYVDIVAALLLTIITGLSIFLLLGSKWIDFITRSAAAKELVL